MTTSGSSIERVGPLGFDQDFMIEARFPRGTEVAPGAHTQTIAALCSSPVSVSLEIHCTTSRASLRVWAADSLALELAAHALRSAWPTVTLESANDLLPSGLPSLGFECLMRYDPAIPLSPADGVQPVGIVDGILSVAGELDAGEFALWQVVLSPVTDGKWPRRARSLAARIETGSAGRGDRQLAHAIEEKAGRPQALAAVRAVALSPDRGRARVIAGRLKGSLTFGNYHNALVAVAPGPAAEFMRRVRLRSPGHMPLSADEIAVLWSHGSGRRPARAVVSGPPTLFIGAQPPPGVRLGTGRSRRGPVEVSVALDGSMPHLLVVGETGSGKSTLCENVFVQFVRSGHGAIFIDPKGGSFNRLYALMSGERREGVQIIDPVGRSSCGFDPIRYARSSPRVDLFVEHVTATLMDLAPAGSTGPRQVAITRSGTKVLTEISGSRFGDMMPLLTDRDWRRPRLLGVKDVDARGFLELQLDRQSPSAAQAAAMPVVNAIAPIISNPFMHKLLEAEPQLDVQRLLDEDGVLLVNAAEGQLGPQASKLLTALIPSVLHLTAAGRPCSAGARKDIIVFIDECHRLPAAVIGHMLSESRAFGIKLVLVTQYLNQVPPEVRSALHGNVGGVIAFRVGGEDAHVLAERLGDGVDARDLMTQESFRATAKLSLPGGMTSAFTLWTDSPLQVAPGALPEPVALPATEEALPFEAAPATASTNGSRRMLRDVDED